MNVRLAALARHIHGSGKKAKQVAAYLGVEGEEGGGEGPRLGHGPKMKT